MDVPFQATSEALLRKAYQDVVFFNLDNHSGTEMLEHAIELLNRAEVALVVAEAQEAEADPSRMLKLMNYLLRDRSAKYHFALLGEHPLLRKMAQPLRENFYLLHSEEELLPLSQNIFS
ncbi:MAG: hypothetical protein ACLFUB_10035 [Cyclobacteriaceae bacterium]